MRGRTSEIRRFWVGGRANGKVNGRTDGHINGQGSSGVDAVSLESAIRNCQEYLLDTQYREGYWWGELESNATITAEYLMLTHFLGIGEKRRWAQVTRYLLNSQREDGTWSVYYDGPGDLNVTVEAYFALKIAGMPAEDPRMIRAREFILSQGGLPNVRNFTKIWLAMLGEWDWNAIPAMPPEMFLLPTWFPFNIYEFSSWARGTIVPMTIIMNKRPVRPVPDHAKISELIPPGTGRLSYTVRGDPGLVSWRRAFMGLDRMIKIGDKWPIRPTRALAIKKAEEWILEHQEANGAWAGIQPPWVYSLIALDCLGYPIEHPAMAKGLEAFETFGIEEEETFRTQSCISPVWDTAWVVIALEESGMSRQHPAMVRAGEWLLEEQIMKEGDWAVKSPGLKPGGWAFEFDNEWYPDIDDAAEVAIALTKVVLDPIASERAINRGIEWIVGMQSRNGGWGAFDKNNTRTLVTQIPFCDFGEVIDPPSVDVTAHILELLGLRGQRAESDPRIAKGLRYIKDEQEEDGSWFGRWGVNYVYGVGAVLPALEALGEDMSSAYVRKAVDWLKDHQNKDGGWGETCASYDDPALAGQGPSTGSQTAWALLGLIASNEARSLEARRGVQYLLDTQGSDGTWPENHFTGTGFPRDFMIKYHMYRVYFPLLALGRYRRVLNGG